MDNIPTQQYVLSFRELAEQCTTATATSELLPLIGGKALNLLKLATRRRPTVVFCDDVPVEQAFVVSARAFDAHLAALAPALEEAGLARLSVLQAPLSDLE